MSIEMTPNAHHEGRTTGRMTTVMRAVPRPEGPRVLRVALVRAGRVVEERLVKQRRDVSVGREAECAIAAPCDPQRLFALRKDRYVLTLGAGMTARVSLDDGVRALVGPVDVPLGDDARGRVTLSDGDTLLFQLVAAPTPMPKPMLPLAVRSGEEIDWRLTMIAALSFLFHFGFVGALYSDWADSDVREAPTVGGLVEMAKLAPANVPVETKESDVVPNAPTKEPSKSTEVAQKASHGTPSASHGPSSPTSSPSSGPTAKQAAMVANAERMAMDVLGTLSTNGSATDRALKRGSDIPPVDLGAEAAKDTSVGPSSAVSTRSTGPVGPTKSDGLAAIAKIKGEPGHDQPGNVRDVHGPVLDTRIDPARHTVPVSDADRVIASLRPRFRRCYEQGLAIDPSMSGRASLTAKIAANGEVGGVDVTVTGLSSGVGQCLAGVLRSAQFSAPGGTGSTLTVPVTLIQR